MLGNTATLIRFDLINSFICLFFLFFLKKKSATGYCDWQQYPTDADLKRIFLCKYYKQQRGAISNIQLSILVFDLKPSKVSAMIAWKTNDPPREDEFEIQCDLVRLLTDRVTAAHTYNSKNEREPIATPREVAVLFGFGDNDELMNRIMKCLSLNNNKTRNRMRKPPLNTATTHHHYHHIRKQQQPPPLVLPPPVIPIVMATAAAAVDTTTTTTTIPILRVLHTKALDGNRLLYERACGLDRDQLALVYQTSVQNITDCMKREVLRRSMFTDGYPLEFKERVSQLCNLPPALNGYRIAMLKIEYSHTYDNDYIESIVERNLRHGRELLQRAGIASVSMHPEHERVRMQSLSRHTYVSSSIMLSVSLLHLLHRVPMSVINMIYGHRYVFSMEDMRSCVKDYTVVESVELVASGKLKYAQLKDNNHARIIRRILMDGYHFVYMCYRITSHRLKMQEVDAWFLDILDETRRSYQVVHANASSADDAAAISCVVCMKMLFDNPQNVLCRGVTPELFKYKHNIAMVDPTVQVVPAAQLARIDTLTTENLQQALACFTDYNNCCYTPSTNGINLTHLYEAQRVYDSAPAPAQAPVSQLIHSLSCRQDDLYQTMLSFKPAVQLREFLTVIRSHYVTMYRHNICDHPDVRSLTDKVVVDFQYNIIDRYQLQSHLKPLTKADLIPSEDIVKIHRLHNHGLNYEAIHAAAIAGCNESSTLLHPGITIENMRLLTPPSTTLIEQIFNAIRERASPHQLLALVYRSPHYKGSPTNKTNHEYKMYSSIARQLDIGIATLTQYTPERITCIQTLQTTADRIRAYLDTFEKSPTHYPTHRWAFIGGFSSGDPSYNPPSLDVLIDADPNNNHAINVLNRVYEQRDAKRKAVAAAEVIADLTTTSTEKFELSVHSLKCISNTVSRFANTYGEALYKTKIIEAMSANVEDAVNQLEEEVIKRKRI